MEGVVVVVMWMEVAQREEETKYRKEEMKEIGVECKGVKEKI